MRPLVFQCYSLATFGGNSKPWRAGLSVVIFEMRWSPSPSSLEDEAALWFAASSVSKPAYSWSQLLLFISLCAVIFCE